MLAPLQTLVAALRDDLRDCLDGKTDEPADRKAQLDDASAHIRAEYDALRKIPRTSQPFSEWREDYLTQVAVAWVLACVFVRYLEDNAFVGECWLGGPDDPRRDESQARRAGFFREKKTATDRDYLAHVFNRMASIPAAHDLFARDKTPLWVVGPSGDAATRLLNFWHTRDEDGNTPAFVQADGNTRFLGDLYQGLSEEARKKYALLQTPEFVEEFILDRTLTPACREFGFQNVRLIDPTCGSGHFLLGAFDRLMRLWEAHYHELTGHEWNAQDAAGRVLGVEDGYHGQVFGVDINPYAVAIARFRLMIAACKWCGITRLSAARAWRPRVYCGDSLYFGDRWAIASNKKTEARLPGMGVGMTQSTLEHPDDCNRVLGQKYHAVVGNPPYITVKDAALNQRYRDRYDTCHQKYSLGVPFTERFWDICEAADDTSPPGFVGMITTNSFMKREFGKKLIEEFFFKIDLTHVIDTSGASIPGHGTPTVVLFGRNRLPQGDAVRAVLGIRGEPGTPDDPALGLVWSSIVGNVDNLGTQDEFVSVVGVSRTTFARHPWSIGGGGAAELKEQLDGSADQTLGEVVQSIGITSVTGADDVYVYPEIATAIRYRIGTLVSFVTGEHVTDWSVLSEEVAIWPYTGQFQVCSQEHLVATLRTLWNYKAPISTRRRFGTPMLSKGARWYEWQELYSDKLRSPLAITFPCVATHNHFALDLGSKLFNRHAPVVKLPPTASLEQYQELLGVLNSSIACFWMKQVMTGKHKGDGGEAHADPAYQRFEFASTQIEAFPLPVHRPVPLPRLLSALAQQYAAHLPAAVCKYELATRANLNGARQEAESIRRRMISLQEELDWECYHLYGLTDESLTLNPNVTKPEADDSPSDLGDSETLREVPISLGERAFEIVLARSGEKTAWFERHRSTPITELPTHWPADYRALVERRLAEIESNPNIRLIERPEYKRRWSSDTWEEMEQRALRSWLLDRLETERYWPRGEPALRSCDQIANEAAADADFLQVAGVYKGGPVEPASLITELVLAEAVPYLPVLRYKESGLRKRAQWEETWRLQREEDRISAEVADLRAAREARATEAGPEPNEDAQKALQEMDLAIRKKEAEGRTLGESILVPPKYTSADFLKSDYWRLRGKLDVPKERWVSYPGAERDGDPTPVVTWAGYDHREQAQALAAYYQEAKDQKGWTAERLVPLLAGLDQLVPWLMQWHNEYSDEFGGKPGDEIEVFVATAAADMRMSLEAIRAWKPEPKATSRKGRKGRKGRKD